VEAGFRGSSSSEATRLLNEAMALRQSGQGMEPAMPGTSYDFITEQRSSAHLTHSSCPQAGDRQGSARKGQLSFFLREALRVQVHVQYELVGRHTFGGHVAGSLQTDRAGVAVVDAA
jgi:hypothetical protein